MKKLLLILLSVSFIALSPVGSLAEEQNEEQQNNEEYKEEAPKKAAISYPLGGGRPPVD